MGVGHWVAAPGVDADVDYAATLAPLLVDVAMKEPPSRVGGRVVLVAVLAAGVAAVGEVAGQHLDVTWEGEGGLAVMELEAGSFVALGTTSSEGLVVVVRCRGPGGVSPDR